MLRRVKEERSLKENLMLASSTALVSGGINVAGVMAFLAFTTNVTGHVATLARHVVEQNIREILVFFAWLFMFFFGAFVSSFLIRSFEPKSRYRAHATPILFEIVILLLVAIYGHHFYDENRTEREIIIGAILFSMGLQNSMVSNISGGLIKVTHLSGLLTDFGSEVGEWLHPNRKNDTVLRNKLFIRMTILTCYFIGGILGGYLFTILDFQVFYFIPALLMLIISYDILPLMRYKTQQFFSIFSSRKKSTQY
ncbi:DUF1275 domain-containing protein [Mucilaginibacter robiniae]|uniref:DUF1275 domain-containing protein n=1 Tax=Mucilaginibacter robiniae TaxID=2728022 RepID=A0A7L5DVH4_9SPHI|nr:YoaK family protein [Mucilaginibacter robiniae]QJD95090.1 DUF1275 domain-containing protein [Mucilaginibacter robiniae]